MALSLLLLFVCSASAALNFTIVHTNSVRGRILQHDATGARCTLTRSCCDASPACFGGFSRVATVIREARRRRQNVLVLDSGDQEGDTIFWLTYKGFATRELMIAMNYDAKAFATSEFFLGADNFVSNYGNQTHFTVLGSNAKTSKPNDALASIIKPYTIKFFDGVRVGIMAYSEETLCDRSSCDFRLEMQPISSSILSTVAQLKSQNVDLIICISSLRDPTFDAALAASPNSVGIDIIISGSNTYDQSPEKYTQTVQGSDGRTVLILSAPMYARGVGVADIFVGTGPGFKIRDFSASVVILNTSVPFDNETSAALGPLESGMQETLRTIVGQSTTGLHAEISGVKVVRTREVAVGNLVCDALLDAYKSAGANVAVMNSGGIRGTVGAGNITFESVLQILPFSNLAATVKVTGAVLFSALENAVSQVESIAGRFLQVSGIRFSFNRQKPAGIRVGKVEIYSSSGWKDLENAKVYMVVTNAFVRQGGDGYSDTFGNPSKIDLESVFDYGPAIDTVLRNYLKNYSPVSPAVEGRIIENNVTASRPVCQYSLDITKASGYVSDACGGTERLQSYITWTLMPLLSDTTAAIDINFEQVVTELTFGKEKLQVISGTQNAFREWAFTTQIEQYEGTTNPIPPFLRVFGSAVRIVYSSTTFRNDSGVGFQFSAVSDCPGGTYQSAAGLNLDCRPCPAGTFGRVTPGKSSADAVCRPCPPGSFSDEGATVCTLCNAGTFSSGERAASCAPCAVGTFQNTTGSSLCFQCSPGTYTKNQKSVQCDPCEPGTSQSESGQSGCVKCGLAMYANSTGSSTCSLCPNMTTTETRGASSQEACECVSGAFNPSRIPGEICLRCPVGGTCIGGEAMPFAQLGYWGNPALLFQDTNLAGSFFCTDAAPWDRCGISHWNSFFECDSASACAGDCNLGDIAPTAPAFAVCRQNVSNICSQNTAGPMCTICDNGFFSFGGSCMECASTYSQRVVITIFSISGTLIVWIILNVAASENFASIDIGLLYLQVADMIGRFNMRWGTNLGDAIGILNLLNFDVDFVTPACLTSWTYRETLFTQNFLPASLAVLNILKLSTVWVGSKISIYSEEDYENAKNACIRQSMSFINVTYAGVLMNCLSSFFCTTLADGTEILTNGPMFACWDETHRGMMGISSAGLLLYSVGFPVFTLAVLFHGKRAHLLSDPNYLERYSFCYHRYNQESYYWELVMLARKFFISFIVVVGQSAPELQASATFILLIIAGGMHIRTMPFIDNKINILEICCIFSNMLFLLAGLLHYSGNTSDSTLAGIDIVVLISFVGVTAIAALLYLVSLYEMALRHRVATLMKKHAILTEPERISWRHRLNSVRFDFSSFRKFPVSPENLPNPRHVDRDKRRLESRELATMEGIRGGVPLYGELLGGKGNKLSECLKHHQLHDWLKIVKPGSASLRAFIEFDRAVTPLVTESSEVSVYSHTPRASFFRRLLRTFPSLIYWSAHAPHQSVANLAKILEEIIETLHDERADSWADAIEEQHYSAVFMTFLRLSETSRMSARLLIGTIAGHSNSHVENVVSSYYQSPSFTKSLSSKFTRRRNNIHPDDQPSEDKEIVEDKDLKKDLSPSTCGNDEEAIQIDGRAPSSKNRVRQTSQLKEKIATKSLAPLSHITLSPLPNTFEDSTAESALKIRPFVVGSENDDQQTKARQSLSWRGVPDQAQQQNRTRKIPRPLPPAKFSYLKPDL